MKRKFFLFCFVLLIFKLSSTSNLQVSNPHTWLNMPHYRIGVSMNDFFNLNSRFYFTYYEAGMRYITKEFVYHKVAHITFYSLLGFFALCTFHNLKKFRYFSSLGFVFLVAYLDEINQYFVEGRTGIFLDVLIDLTAATICLILVRLFIDNDQYKKIKRNNISNFPEAL